MAPPLRARRASSLAESATLRRPRPASLGVVPSARAVASPSRGARGFDRLASHRAAPAAAALLALALLAAPPARLLELPGRGEPWLSYDEYVIPEAAVALCLGLEPPIVLGTPASPSLLLSAVLVLGDAVLADGGEGDDAPARLQHAAERLLVDPAPLILPLRWLSIAASVLAAALLASVARRLATTAGERLLGLVVGASLLLAPPVASRAPTGLAEGLAVAALCGSLACAVRAVEAEERAASGLALWLGCGALAGVAGAAKGNFGLSAALGPGLILVARVLRAPCARALRTLAALAGGTAIGFVTACPFALARPLQVLKAQLFAVGHCGGQAAAAAHVGPQLVAGLGSPLLVLTLPAALVTWRQGGPRGRLLVVGAGAYAVVLASMRFGKLPWFGPWLPWLLAVLACAAVRVARRGRPALVVAVLGVVAVAAVDARASARTLHAAASLASAGRALRAWARDVLPSSEGETLVVGRHLELLPTRDSVEAELATLEETIATRRHELGPGGESLALIEERWDRARLELLATAATGARPRYRVQGLSFAPLDALPELAASGRFERIACTRVQAEPLLRQGLAEVERSFPCDPLAPGDMSFDLVVLRTTAGDGPVDARCSASR